MAEKSIPTPESISLDFHVVWERIDSMVTSAVAQLPMIILGIVTFVLIYLGAGLIGRLIRKTFGSEEQKNLGIVISRVTRWALIGLGILLALTIMIPSVTPGKVIGALGVSSIAIGFAFKDILQNLLAGLLILLRKPFNIGDQIRSGDYEGTVKAVETRATLIRTYDGKRVIIPNSEIYTNAVVVNTAHDSRRSEYDIGIGYGDDIETAKTAIYDVLGSTEGVLSEPEPEVLVTELAGSWVSLRARWWTKPSQKEVLHTQSRVIQAVKEKLDQEAIDMPYPTNVVLLHNQTEVSDGDRNKQREGWPAGDSPPRPLRMSRASGDKSSGIRSEQQKDSN